MTPERMAKLVARWVRFYTRDLPTPVAQRRTNEIEADLHDHTAYERAHGTSDRRIALSILSRMVRGLAADVSWRDQHARAIIDHPSTPKEAMKKHYSAFRSVVRPALATALILLLPFLAMQLDVRIVDPGQSGTEELAWTLGDFIVAGVLLFGTGLAYELVARKRDTIAYRAAVGVALAAALLLVWINLAVGIIGSENNPANLMYFGVLAVGLIGAFIARLEPHGMARALFAMALAQALVGVIALIARLGSTGPIWPLDVLGLTGFFAALWLISAWLFQNAAREHPPVGAGPHS